MVQALNLSQAIPKLLGELLSKYAEAVPEEGLFPDLVATEPVRHRSYLNGSECEIILELAVRAMNPDFDPSFRRLRFLAVRAHSPETQGFVSTTLFHASTAELRSRLASLADDPAELIEAAQALIEGLPVETDPDLWR